jgi:murein DD-endopeptidase MepM/ murein hydrolase activator NlpD
MSNNKGNGGLAGRGYYIALVLCAVAIGITSYVYYRNADQPEQAAVQETWADAVVGTREAEDLPVIATQAPQPDTPSSQPTQPAPTEKRVLKTVSPLAGEEVFGYSMEALSYNQTTRDWRVHNGVDLAAETGAQVVAAADGEVYKVYEDESLGHTVIIRHADGYTTAYSCLAEDIAVAEGEQVKMGQTIGCAGESAVVETALGCHVHFSVTQYDKPVDPAEFLSLGK